MLRDVRPTPFPPLPVLAEALAGVPLPELEGAAIEAAVLVCLHDDAVLLARRRACIPHDPWSGHVALPGGRWEPGDASLLATALREAEEEVGIDPLAHGRLLGALGTHVGRGRRVGGVRIAVFVAALDERPRARALGRARAAHWVPLERARARHRARRRAARRPTSRLRGRALPDGDRLVVWGITYAILERLRALPAGVRSSPRTASSSRGPAPPAATARCGSPGRPAALPAGSPSAARRRRTAPPVRSRGISAPIASASVQS